MANKTVRSNYAKKLKEQTFFDSFVASVFLANTYGDDVHIFKHFSGKWNF